MITESPLHETRRRALIRWLFAALLVVSLHVGSAALAFIHWPERDERVEDMGAPMVVELAEMPSSPETETPESAAGEPSEAAPVMPEVDETLSAKSESDLPTAPASPYEAPPELQVLQERTQKQTDQSQDAQPTDASEPTPPTPSSAPAQEAAQSAPPVIVENALVGSPAEGSAADLTKAQETWYRAIMVHLGKHKTYPQAARARRIEGEVLVRFSIDRVGRILRTDILRSSGSRVLDEEVIKLLRRAEPLPSLPPQMRKDEAELTIPIRYHLKG